MATEKATPTGAPIASCDEAEGCTVVPCAACLREIPGDVALSAEGPDYVQYFCGLDCMGQWQEKAKKAKKASKP